MWRFTLVIAAVVVISFLMASSALADGWPACCIQPA